MGEEINEGVKLKPRVMAGNNLVARSELFPLPHPLVLFVGPLLDESGGLEMGWRREGRSTRATSPRVPPQLLNRPAQLLPPKKSNRRDKCADMSGGLISTSLSPRALPLHPLRSLWRMANKEPYDFLLHSRTVWFYSGGDLKRRYSWLSALRGSERLTTTKKKGRARGSFNMEGEAFFALSRQGKVTQLHLKSTMRRCLSR